VLALLMFTTACSLRTPPYTGAADEAAVGEFGAQWSKRENGVARFGASPA